MLQNRGVAITGPLIQETALDFWHRLQVYQDLEPPKFSDGWLHKWKQRYGVKKYGEDASVIIDAPRISYTAALEALETLTLFKLQAGTMDSTQQQLFWRERRRIEGAQKAEKGRQRQRTLEEWLGMATRDV